MFEADARVKCYLARVVFDAGRVQEAAAIIKSLIEAKYTFQSEDRNLVIAIWRELINPLRYAICALENCRKPNEHMAMPATTLKNTLLQRLNEVLGVIESFVGQVTEVTKGNYLKTLADFQRYKLECLGKSEGHEIAHNCRENYQKAIEIFRKFSQECGELLIGSQLNLSILLAEYLDQRKKAYDIVSELHHSLSISIEKYPEEMRGRLRNMLIVMQSNCEKWKPPEEVEF